MAPTGLPGYADAVDDMFRISRQGGLINLVFKVDHPSLESAVQASLLEKAPNIGSELSVPVRIFCHERGLED